MTDASKALFLTYASGTADRLAQACPGEGPQRLSQHEYELKMVDGGTYLANNEAEIACYWTIESPLRKEDFIEGQSELTLVLETAINAQVFVFTGEKRDEVKELVELGDKLYPGNPLRITD